MKPKSYLFRDKLKAPGRLTQLDVARIRKIANEATEEEFQEYLSCSKRNALRILSFWEVAQVPLWDAEILKRFFHEWIYEDRQLVVNRIEAAQLSGALPERFTSEAGLLWLETENVMVGSLPEWVRANSRVRPLANKRKTRETAIERQDRRLQACIDAGLDMDTDTALRRLPYGVGRLAKAEGVSRPTFSVDVIAALERRERSTREGVTKHRA